MINDTLFVNEIECYEIDVGDGYYSAYTPCACCDGSMKYESKSKIKVKNGEIDYGTFVNAANDIALHNDRNIYLESIIFDDNHFRLFFGS